MLSQSGVTKETYYANNQILFTVEPKVVVGVQLKGAVGVIKAGTPITGDLMNRNGDFTVTAADDVVGVTLHDVEIKDATKAVNSECLIFGFVDVKKVHEDVAKLYTETIVTGLAGKVWFLK